MKIFIRAIIVGILLITNSLYAKTIELSGTVISDNEKYITSRFMGYIKTVNVCRG